VIVPSKRERGKNKKCREKIDQKKKKRNKSVSVCVGVNCGKEKLSRELG
jgi:hypothetical protein